MRQLRTVITDPMHKSNDKDAKWYDFPIIPKWTNNQCTVMWNAMVFVAFLLLVHTGSGAWSLLAFLLLGGFREDKCVKCRRESKDGEYTDE